MRFGPRGQVAYRDPFDRMLAAQSILERMPLVARDPAFEQFGIQMLWRDCDERQEMGK
jgi:PIN domain nuclease of toxin-antitoxin system